MASTAWPPEPVASGPSQPEESARKAAFLRIALLIGLAVFVSATSGAFSGVKSSFLMKDALGLSATQFSLFNIFAGIPAYLRPFMGAGSDLFPLFGFHRRSYYLLGWLLYIVGNIALAFLHPYRYASVLCLVLVTAAGGNLLMVIMDAVMVTIGNLTGTVGRLQSIQQGIPLVLALAFTSELGGWTAQHWSYKACFLATGVVALLGIPLTLLIAEKHINAGESHTETTEEREARLARRREDRARTIAALGSAARSGHLWAIVGFVFYLILTPGTGTAQFFYSVNVLHFSKLFIGQLGMPNAAGAICAIVLFAIFSKRVPVRAVVWAAYLMDCSLYLISFGLVNRPTGIIVTFVGAFLGMIYALALYTLAARATPKGIEGTVYGLVIAAIGLAGTLGDLIGSKIFLAFGPPHYTVTQGWHALLWFGFAFTVIAVVFIPFLPAWARSSEPLGSTVQHSPDEGDAAEAPNSTEQRSLE